MSFRIKHHNVPRIDGKIRLNVFCKSLFTPAAYIKKVFTRVSFAGHAP